MDGWLVILDGYTTEHKSNLLVSAPLCTPPTPPVTNTGIPAWWAAIIVPDTVVPPDKPYKSNHGDESLSWTVRSMLCNYEYNVGHIIGPRNPHCLASESSNSIFASPFKMTAPPLGPEDFSDLGYFGWIFRVNIHLEGCDPIRKDFFITAPV